jgi:hypothetical protein
MTDPIFSPVDPALIEKKAEEKATQKIEELKSTLANALSGQSAEDAPPESWGKLRSEIEESKSKAVDEAEQRILKKIESQRQQDEQRQQLTLKQQQDQVQKEWADLTAEWKEAVADGLLPDIADPIKQKLAQGIVYSDLSDAEKEDPGLRTYNEVVRLHGELKRDGKSRTLYRTIDKFYNRQPAGVNAPVFGGSVASQPSKESYSYEEVRANSRKKYKI